MAIATSELFVMNGLLNNKMKYLFYIALSVISIGCKQSTVEVAQTLDELTGVQVKPIMLDDVHYYTLDRQECNQFFETNFGTRAMKEDSSNPFEFIDFQLVKSGQSTINISKQGPFPGIKVGDPKRWERKLVTPSPNNSPRFGVHWVALGIHDLPSQIIKLKENGVAFINENVKLPHTSQKAALCYGPDYNLLLIIESEKSDQSLYSIDHLMLLVQDLEKNINFYTDVFGGDILSRNDDFVEMSIGNHTFILAEPSALGIDVANVKERDPSVFRPDIDHLGFLYEDIQPAYDYAVSKGYSFLSKPVPISYFGRATLYTFAITYSPDGLQCELFQEAGRLGSRKNYKE